MHFIGFRSFFITLLEELTTKTGKSEEEMRDSEYPLLLREMKMLQDALPSSTPD